MAITTAKGTTMEISDNASPLVYAAIAQVRSITGPTVKPKIQDITTHDTAGFWSRKIATLIEAGTLSFEINFDHAQATHAFTTGLWNQMIGLIKSGFRNVFPNAAGTLTYLGYVAMHEFAAPVDNVLIAKIQLQITDAITAV
jgi:predicted secreted protein